MTARELSDLRDLLATSPAVEFHPVDVAVTDACTAISRKLLTDPWDRFIVATAMVLQTPLVTRDGAIARSGLVDIVW